MFSGLVHGLFGYDNVGFHIGTEAVTMDFNGMLTEADVRRVELLANQAVWRDQPKVYTCGKRRVRCLDRYDLTNLQGEAAAGLYGTIGSHFHIKLARCAHHRNGLLRAQTFFCGRYIYSKTGQHHDQCQYDSQALVLLHLFHPLPFAATIPGQMLLRLLPHSPLCYSLKQDSRSCPEKTWNRGLLP